MADATAKVTVKATHIIQSEHQISLQNPFVLGPFDQLGHYATPVNTVWIYGSSSVNLIPVDRLRRAISRLLDYYPHLTGRLTIDPETGVRSITRLGTGMHLLEAHCDAPLQTFARRSSGLDPEFSVFDFPGRGNALLSPWDLSLNGAQRDPVFTIQRTEFACSAVAIGMRLSHVVGGAGSFLGLYQDLAEIYRGIGPAGDQIELASPPHLPPFMATNMLYMNIEEQRKALTQQPPNYSLKTNDEASEDHWGKETHLEHSPDTDPVLGRSLRFTPQALVALKSQAVRPGDSRARVSAFTALSAHIWQRTHLARLKQAKSCTKQAPICSSSTFGTSVSFVPHLGLPRRLFGNTVVTPIITLDSTKLAQAPLWEVTEIINGLVRHVSEDEVDKLGTWIAAQPKKSRIQFSFQVTPTSFIATGWHRFPLWSGAELEVPPIFASPVFMESLFDGMVCFVVPRAKDGGLDAIATMKSSAWAHLEKDEAFISNWDKRGL
ncbi:transferase [Fusarium oxysporum]|nr:transferase [Fusarium oxysporum]